MTVFETYVTPGVGCWGRQTANEGGSPSKPFQWKQNMEEKQGKGNKFSRVFAKIHFEVSVNDSQDLAGFDYKIMPKFLQL